jgi:hypothetical protein
MNHGGIPDLDGMCLFAFILKDSFQRLVGLENGAIIQWGSVGVVGFKRAVMVTTTRIVALRILTSQLDLALTHFIFRSFLLPP